MASSSSTTTAGFKPLTEMGMRLIITNSNYMLVFALSTGRQEALIQNGSWEQKLFALADAHRQLIWSYQPLNVEPSLILPPRLVDICDGRVRPSTAATSGSFDDISKVYVPLLCMVDNTTGDDYVILHGENQTGTSSEISQIQHHDADNHTCLIWNRSKDKTTLMDLKASTISLSPSQLVKTNKPLPLPTAIPLNNSLFALVRTHEIIIIDLVCDNGNASSAPSSSPSIVGGTRVAAVSSSLLPSGPRIITMIPNRPDWALKHPRASMITEPLQSLQLLPRWSPVLGGSNGIAFVQLIYNRGEHPLLVTCNVFFSSTLSSSESPNGTPSAVASTSPQWLHRRVTPDPEICDGGDGHWLLLSHGVLLQGVVMQDEELDLIRVFTLDADDVDGSNSLRWKMIGEWYLGHDDNDYCSHWDGVGMHSMLSSSPSTSSTIGMSGTRSLLSSSSGNQRFITTMDTIIYVWSMPSESDSSTIWPSQTFRMVFAPVVKIEPLSCDRFASLDSRGNLCIWNMNTGDCELAYRLTGSTTKMPTLALIAMPPKQLESVLKALIEMVPVSFAIDLVRLVMSYMLAF
jgi:hypothetical protein